MKMIVEYIQEALKRVKYELIKKSHIMGEVPELKGVWAQRRTLEVCV